MYAPSLPFVRLGEGNSSDLWSDVNAGRLPLVWQRPDASSRLNQTAERSAPPKVSEPPEPPQGSVQSGKYRLITRGSNSSASAIWEIRPIGKYGGAKLNHIEELSKIRKIAAKLATAEDLPAAIGDSARYVLQSMIEEAEEYGFTKAEVIRAIFRPVFRPQKGCDCFACKARRDAAYGTQRCKIESHRRTLQDS